MCKPFNGVNYNLTTYELRSLSKNKPFDFQCTQRPTFSPSPVGEAVQLDTSIERGPCSVDLALGSSEVGQREEELWIKHTIIGQNNHLLGHPQRMSK